MKYHSTKKSILTIAVIISVLLGVSAFGIFKFQAQTPIQALTSAVLSNLEMPNGYNIKVENINESFLSSQKVEKISLTKNNKPLITLSNLSTNQSLFNYIEYLFFNRSLKLEINATDILINISENIDDLLQSLLGIKIADNTIAIQGQLEKKDVIKKDDPFDIRGLLNLIIQQQYIDLSPILGEAFTNNSIKLTIDRGTVHYANEDIALNTNINNLNFEIAKKGILNKFDFKLSAIDYKSEDIDVDSNNATIFYLDNNINIFFDTSHFSYLNNKIDIENATINYSLENTGKVLLSVRNIAYKMDGINFKASDVNSELTTNFKDFSVLINPKYLLFSLNDDHIEFFKPSFGLSYVEDNLSLFINNENYTSISLENNVVNLQGLDLSLLSKDFVPYKTNIKLSQIEYNRKDLISKVNNFDISINSDIDNSFIVTNGKFDSTKVSLDNLKNVYNNIYISIYSDVYAKYNKNSINSSFNSFIELQDNFQNITASLFTNDLKLNSLKQDISADINLQGPLKLAPNHFEAVEANITYGKNFSIKAVGQFEEKLSNNTINTTIFFDDFKIEEFYPVIVGFLPPLNNYIDEQTQLTGSINYVGNIALSNKEKFNGDLNSSVLIKNAKFLESKYDLGFNLSTKIFDQYLDVKQLSLSLFNYRLAFDGKFILDTKSLFGSLNLENIEKAEKIINIDFDNVAQDRTNFILTALNYPNFSFDGSFINVTPSIYQVTSSVNLKSESLDLFVVADLKNSIFNASSNKGLKANVKVGENISATLNLDNLALIDLNNSIFNGNLNFILKETSLWSFIINNFDFSYNNNLFDILLNGEITQNSIALNRLDYNNNQFDNKFEGTLDYNGPEYLTLFKNRFKDHYKLNFTFGDNTSQRIEASLFNNSDISKVFLEVSKFNISRIFTNKNEILLDARLLGTTDFNSKNDIKGSIEFNETEIINPTVNEYLTDNDFSTPVKEEEPSFLSQIVTLLPFVTLPSKTTSSIAEENLQTSTSGLNVSTNLNITDKNLLFDNFNINFGNLTLEDSYLALNLDKFDIAYKSTVELIKLGKVTDQLNTLDIDFYLNFNSLVQDTKEEFTTDEVNLKTVLSLFSKLDQYKGFDYNKFNNVYGHLNLTNFNLLKDIKTFEKLWPEKVSDSVFINDINSSFNFIDGKLILTGDNIKANVDFDSKKGFLSIDKEVGLAGDFDFNYDTSFDVFASNLDVPISIIEKAIYLKIVKLYGDNITGEILIKDLLKQPKFYGQLNSKSIKVNTLYTYNNVLEIPNVTFILDNNKLYNNKTKANYFDVDNNKNTPFYAAIDIVFDNLVYQYIDIALDIPQYIPLYLPLRKANITITSEAKNQYNLRTDGKTVYSSGNINLRNSLIAPGVNLLPWIDPSQNTNIDLTINTDENNSFYYPQFTNPILSVTVDKNQSFNYKFDSVKKSYSLDGKINILQGEIFYFQKNFYINSGTLALEMNNATGQIEPIISLEATLREIDSQREPVDIILSLRNNTLNNISPNFSSIPVKSQQEIMSILGQSFSPISTEPTSSVASIATAATSVFSTLGYIDTGGAGSLNKTIASTLNLDFFSLKSNIVENILLGTFIEDPRYASFSPLARYLNNTTIYMGKELTPNSKIQVMINLLASNDTNTRSFLSKDLSLDFEMSYEVDTQLADFSFFTNPTQLSILEILDTIGFSITKTIHLL